MVHAAARWLNRFEMTSTGHWPGRSFDSLDEVNSAFFEMTMERNRAPREAFDSLSSEQVARLFSEP